MAFIDLAFTRPLARDSAKCRAWHSQSASNRREEVVVDAGRRTLLLLLRLLSGLISDRWNFYSNSLGTVPHNTPAGIATFGRLGIMSSSGECLWPQLIISRVMMKR